MLLFLNNISLIEWIVFGVVFLFFIIRLYFYFLQLKFIKKFKHTDTQNYFVPVSVIIAAKNEAKNLEKFLPEILQQDYPEFEVVVVNDGSNDNTEEVLGKLKAKFLNLRTTFIKADPKFTHNKKLAISIGIKAAQFEHMVFTDADCCVTSDQWLKLMTRKFQRHEIILGYGGYLKKNSFINKLIRYDTVRIAILFLSKAASGKPYMGVGRNMAYTKTIYQKTKGFSSHYFISTGDDDLFINQASTSKNTTIEIDQNAFTYSVPPDNFREWMHQKSRHLSGSKYYSFGQKLFLGIESLSRSLFLLMIIASIIFFSNLLWLLLGLFLLDLIIYWFTNKPLLNHLKEKDLLAPGIIFDILVTFLIFIRLSLNIFTRQNK